MADFPLLLGDVQFADFEIPDSIKGGGAQALDIKRYGGGLRTVDAFGPDDAPISWSGMFLDDTAESRCQQLDAMRRAGSQVQLSYGSFNYAVVISRFEWDYQKFYQIPYSITLEVVQDNVQPATDQGDSLESDMQGDLDDSSAYSDALDDPDFTGDLGTVFSDVQGMSSITGGSVPGLTQLLSDIGVAGGRASDLESAADTAMDQLGVPANFASGVDPLAMANSLSSMSGSSFELCNSFGAANSLTKLSKSVASVLTGG